MPEQLVHDLGVAEFVTPEAIGKPGQRTFKISARSARGAATIWMEKEQLFQIGLSIKQFASSRPEVEAPSPFEPEHPAPPVPVEVEFKVGDMSLRHDSASDTFTLAAANYSEDDEVAPGEEREAPVQVLVSFARREAEKLADRTLEVVAAGRQPCSLCGAPMDDAGHFCVRKNGHRTG